VYLSRTSGSSSAACPHPPRGKKAEDKPITYEVTETGRLTVTDMAEKTGFEPGAKFTLEKPRGKSNAWRLVPVE